MKNFKEKFTFYLSGLLYLLMNLSKDPNSVDITLMGVVKATLWQLAQTIPFIAGITWIIVAFLQYMAKGKKMPWERRFRIFFAVGIMASLIYGFYQHAGVKGF